MTEAKVKKYATFEVKSGEVIVVDPYYTFVGKKLDNLGWKKDISYALLDPLILEFDN